MVQPVRAEVKEPPVYKLSGAALGTTWTVKWRGEENVEHSDKLRPAIEKVLGQVDAEMSTYRGDSEVSQFNASNSTNWIPVSTDTLAVTQISLAIAKRSGGALDPTVFPLVKVWGFGPDRKVGQLPTVGEVARARSQVGYTNLEVRVNPPAVRKLRPQVMVDFSAVAKGYAVDRIVEELGKLGVKDVLVEAGGELRASGHSWLVGIERPDSNGTKIQRALPLLNQSIAASGDDRNFREIHGHRYHHIMDPHTGWPAEQHVASAAVLHRSCAWADGWATAMIVLGVEKGRSIAEREGLAVLWMERKGDSYIEYLSPAFKTTLDAAAK